jgi:hypothetical protein
MMPVPPPMEPGIRPRRTPSKGAGGKPDDVLGNPSHERTKQFLGLVLAN